MESLTTSNSWKGGDCFRDKDLLKMAVVYHCRDLSLFLPTYLPSKGKEIDPTMPLAKGVVLLQHFI